MAELLSGRVKEWQYCRVELTDWRVMTYWSVTTWGVDRPEYLDYMGSGKSSINGKNYLQKTSSNYGQ